MVLRTLADLNDQLCYFLFSSEEFTSRLGSFSEKGKGLYTTDLFSQNEYAPRIHIKIAELEGFAHQMEKSVLSTFFSASYEATALFLSESLDFIAYINRPRFTIARGNGLGPEELLQKSLLDSGLHGLNNPDFLTLTYMRLRRNHLIHRASKISPHFSTFIANNANTLDHHWIGTAQNLDFSSLDIFEFDERECIDCLEILFILVKRVDECIASQLNEAGIADRIAKELFASAPQKINRDIIKQRAGKIDGRLKHEYGGQVSKTILEQKAVVYGRK